jgi:ribonuclease VapC
LVVSAEPERFVLDSFALLAYLGDEHGRERVEAVLAAAARDECSTCVSVINLGEVLYITERERGLAQAQAALAALDQLPLRVLPADREAVLAAAHVKANHRLSYAGSFAVATAQALGATVLTGDPKFASVGSLVSVEWLAS